MTSQEKLNPSGAGHNINPGSRGPKDTRTSRQCGREPGAPSGLCWVGEAKPGHPAGAPGRVQAAVGWKPRPLWLIGRSRIPRGRDVRIEESWPLLGGRIDGWCNDRRVIRNVESARCLSGPQPLWQPPRCCRTEPVTCPLTTPSLSSRGTHILDRLMENGNESVGHPPHA